MAEPAAPSAPPTPDDAVLRVSGVSYAFKKRVAVRRASFHVRERSIHGFVGPNGAGKTTTLKIIATLLKPQSGSVTVFGHHIVHEARKVRRRIGFMPDHFSMYRQMTVAEYLDFFAAAYGMSVRDRDPVIQDVLALTDMSGRQNDLIRGLSRGMQQRVSLARVLVHDPDLLLLDEPASGLDPRARIELMDILRELSRLGKTIFISSHILSELATLCDSVTILDRGEVRFTGDMAGLLAAADGTTATYVLTVDDPSAPAALDHVATPAAVAAADTTSGRPPEDLADAGTADGPTPVDPPSDGAGPSPAPPALSALETALRVLPGVAEVRREDGVPRYFVAFDREQIDTNAILAAAMGSGVRVVSFQEDVKHLNQAFMDLTAPGVPGGGSP